MAAATVNALLDEVEDFQLPPRKKPKVSELPLSSAQRASIDGMLHTFKKKGDFDALRKKALQQYNESAQRGMFEAALRKFTADEIDREPVKYLKPDRRLAAPLLEGAAARANVYDQSQADVDSYIEQYLATAEVTLREIRRKEIGEVAAADEVKRGSKSEEEYKAEAEVRRKDREKKHVEQEKLRLKKEMQERKKQELQALKKKQEELMKETERLQREQKRRQEREEWKKAEKEREKERIAKFNEERERQKKEAEEREKAAQVEREKRQKEREQRDKERLEQEALERLLNEGRAMTDRGRRPELERSESMEPPPRMRHHAPNTTLSKDEMRARGLMPTSLTLRKGDKPDNIPNGPRAPAAMPYEDDIRKRNSRLRSPSPTRSVHSRSHRESAPSYDDRRPARRDDSRDYYRDSSRREAYYRDVEDDREAWRSRRRDDRPDRDRARDRDRDREREREKDKGEEGEVVERASVRPRSRSRDSYRRRESPRRSYRERSRSRSPPRHMARRRSRSRSPAGIDRYVPGGGGAAAGRDRDRDRDRDSRRDRSRDRDRYRDRGDSDRYIPRSERDDADRPRRRERSRSRERRRERSRESYRDRDRERDR